MTRPWMAIALPALVVACASGSSRAAATGTPPAPAPRGAGHEAVRDGGAGEGGAGDGGLRPSRVASGWTSPLYRDHPLVGRIWEVKTQRWVERAVLERAVAAADLALFGETHDNPDHHRLQAELLGSMVAAGRRPAVAFEMLGTEQQATVDESLAQAPRDPDALARAVGWVHSGWPDFAMYRPIFAVALEAGLPIVAANLDRSQAHAVVRRGPGVLPPQVRALLERAGQPSAEEARALREEMAASHCGQLPENVLGPMVVMQRARDAQLAERLLATANQRGAVLITGAGHVRLDRGVPRYLAAAPDKRTIVSVAFLEASPDRKEPQDFAQDLSANALPFDYVEFTPAAEREDPCRELRKRIRAPESPGTPL